MGRYITLNSVFKPFSFEDYIKPYQIYGEAYKEMENQYTDLSDKATILENLANSTQDQVEYQKYKSWSDDLKAQADQLATQGLSPSLRRSLMTTRNRYKNEISPIEDLYKKRDELIREQRDALLKDNSLLFNNNYSEMSLGDFRNLQNQTYTPLSRDKITNDTAALVKSYAQSIVGEPDLTPILDNQYVQTKLTQGIPLEQILLAAQNDKNAPEGLQKIISTIKKGINYDSWGNNKSLIDEAINKGLMAGIESVNYDVKANSHYISPLDWQKLQLQKNELAERQRQFDINLYGVPGSDGKFYKPLGGGKVLITERDNNGTIKSSTIGNASDVGMDFEDIEDKDLNDLRMVTSTKDMIDLEYEPIGGILKANDKWQLRERGEDIGEWGAPVFLGATRSELSDWSGDVRYSGWSNKVHPSLILTEEDFETMSDEAKELIREKALEYGIKDPFSTNDIQIMRVPSRGRKKDGNPEPDDYIIFKRKPRSKKK